MINQNLHMMSADLKRKIDGFEIGFLDDLDRFDYFFNPSCGQAFESNSQVWHFEGGVNKIQELNINFEQLYVFVEAHSEVVLYLKFSDMNQLKKFNMKSLVLENAKLELRVLFEAQGDDVFDLSLINHCVESGADANMRIVYDLSGGSRLNLLTELKFLQAGNNGQILINGIMAGTSLSVVDGKIFIGPKANQTDSSLQQKVLLLSDKCRNIITPALEILTDDVRAAHGVSVSQVPEDVLFYFASRGIGLSCAKKMYKEALKSVLL